MNWLNLRTEILHSPEFIGSDPTARGTWCAMMLWCAQQENGGVVAGAEHWSDRQWQQTCGVTRHEIEAAGKLLTWEGGYLRVFAYPADQEAAFIKMAVGGRNGGLRRALNIHSKKADPVAPLQAPLQAGVEAPVEAKGREGKEKEGKPEGGAASGEALPALVLEVDQGPQKPAIMLFPCSGKVDSWQLTDSLLARFREAYPQIDPLAECRVALAKIESGAVTRKTASGMPRFLFSWMDRATNGTRNQKTNATATTGRHFSDCNDYSKTGI